MRLTHQVLITVAIASVALLVGVVTGSRPNIFDPVIQAALFSLIGVVVVAFMGVGGVALGARIGADAARESARIAQQDAQEDRDEARVARFADRTLELAAQMLDSGSRFMNGYREAAIAVKAGTRPVPEVRLGHTFGQAAQQLRLIVRLPATHAAIDLLVDSLTASGMYEPPDLAPDHYYADWLSRSGEYPGIAEAFEDAVRAELGLIPFERHAPRSITTVPEEIPGAEGPRNGDPPGPSEKAQE